ncbi:hypothetical protein [Nocardia sp. NPDC004750]
MVRPLLARLLTLLARTPLHILLTGAALLDLPAHRVDDVWVWDVRSVR